MAWWDFSSGVVAGARGAGGGTTLWGGFPAGLDGFGAWARAGIAASQKLRPMAPSKDNFMEGQFGFRTGKGSNTLFPAAKAAFPPSDVWGVIFPTSFSENFFVAMQGLLFIVLLSGEKMTVTET